MSDLNPAKEPANGIGSNALLAGGWRFTRHALNRYRERSKSQKRDETLLARMVHLLAFRRHIGGDQWYSRGWVFVVDGDLIITVMKPRTRVVCDRIFVAHEEAT